MGHISSNNTHHMSVSLYLSSILSYCIYLVNKILSSLFKKPKTYHLHAEWEEDFFSLSYWKSFVWFVKLPSLFRRRGMLRGTLELFIISTTLKENKKSEGTNITVNQTIVVLHTAEFTSKGRHEASLRVSHSIIKHKSSPDGEMIKEAFVEAADSLFQDFKNKLEILPSIKALQLSRSAVTRRSNEVMAEDLTQQLRRDIADCESTDTRDTAQMCVFICMVFTDMTVKEELLTLLPMKERTPVPFERDLVRDDCCTHVWRRMTATLYWCEMA